MAGGVGGWKAIKSIFSMIIAAYKSFKTILGRLADKHMKKAGPCACDVASSAWKRREKLRSRSGKNVLTLACRNVAVSPVDPVFIICNVAPWLDISIGIPAGTQGWKSDHVRTKLVDWRHLGLFSLTSISSYCSLRSQLRWIKTTLINYQQGDFTEMTKLMWVHMFFRNKLHFQICLSSCGSRFVLEGGRG